MLETKWLNGYEDITDSHYIRRKVFIDEQNVPEELEMDDLDELCMHIVLYADKKPAATGRIYLSDGEFHLGRIAVLKEYRGQKIGDFIVRLMIRKAFLSGGEKQFIRSQLSARGFYEKLGFIAYGEVYQEAGIEHINMVREGDIGCYC